jgi:RNA polymerase sigma-70 factor (ECF subfamily)
MDRAVATLEAAVAGGNASLARRQLGELRDDADHEAALDVLARGAAQGSPLALELLVEAVDRFGAARRAVRRFLVDESAVDDVTQDTLITVARSVGSFRGDARFTTWLHQVARNRAVDHLRRVRSTAPLDGAALGGGGDGDGRDPPGLRPDTAARLSSVVSSQQAVHQLLAELPDRYRDAVTLRDVERLPYAEVALQLGRNVNTVKSHVARGRALLAALLVERGHEP